MYICGKQNNGHSKTHILTPRTYEYVTFNGRKDLANVIKLRILRWGDYPGWAAWILNVTVRVLKWKGETEDVTLEEHSERCYAAGSEDRGRGPKPRNAGGL